MVPPNAHIIHTPGVHPPKRHHSHPRKLVPSADMRHSNPNPSLSHKHRGLSEESSAASGTSYLQPDVQEKFTLAGEPVITAPAAAVVTGHRPPKDEPPGSDPPAYDIGEPEHRPNVVLQKIAQFFHTRYFIILRDFAMIGLLLGIWIPSVVRKEHRHKWVITTVIAWFFIGLILLHNSKYIPQRPFVRFVTYTWGTFVEKPWFKIPYYARLAFGWTCLFGLYFGTAFGIKATPDAPYRPRGIALFGIFVNYAILFGLSKNWRAVRAAPTIVGLGLQMILGLFVYKTGAGYHLFGWISTALSDLLEQGQLGGATFFWNQEVVKQGRSKLVFPSPHSARPHIGQGPSFFLSSFFVSCLTSHFSFRLLFHQHAEFYPLLRCFCNDDVLHWGIRVGHQEVCLALLQAVRYVGRRSGCCRCFSLHWPRRELRSHAPFCARLHRERISSSADFRILYVETICSPSFPHPTLFTFRLLHGTP